MKDLARLFVGRSLTSCRRDMQYFRTLFEVRERVPGVPHDRLAEYLNRDAAGLLQQLKVRAN